MDLLFTSSSRARSLIRTLLIRPFSSRCALAAHMSLIEVGIWLTPLLSPKTRRLHPRECISLARTSLTTVVVIRIDPLVGDLLRLIHQFIDRVVPQLNPLLARIRVRKRIAPRVFLFRIRNVFGRDASYLL